MKTKILIACLVAGVWASGQPAWAIEKSADPGSDTASDQGLHHARQIHWPSLLFRQDVSGEIPRAIRGGNPMEMLDPFAPAIYGTAGQSLVIDPEHGKWKGVKLLEISF